ncbi:MAG TPA: hypothetical protein VE175_04215 [Woeseiaceae bacterium]|jgi:uncharacterized lipoprotein|nr:hypothetical protein [Woeseiaceae bacterium]
MMKIALVSALSTLVVFLSGCGGTPACMETQPYQRSRLGKHIESPEGLDSLDAQREMTIPEASPRPPRAANAPCLELPPTFRVEQEQPQPAAEAEDEESSNP